MSAAAAAAAGAVSPDSAENAAVPSIPPGMTLVVPPKNREFALNLLGSTQWDSVDTDVNNVWVSTADLNAALAILHEHGRLVISGPPGSGKTRLADAVQKELNNQGYIPRSSMLTMTTCHSRLQLTRAAPLRYVCVEDHSTGHLRLHRSLYLKCLSFLFATQELWDRPAPSTDLRCSLLVVTALPHILREMQMLDEAAVLPLADPKVVVDLTRDPLHPHLPFKPDLQRYAMLLCDMMRHEHGRPPMCALLMLTMQGYGAFLEDPEATCDKIQELDFAGVTAYQVAELADYLRGFLVHESGAGFVNRLVYEAAGLALGRAYALSMLLRVCDTPFFAKHVRMDPDAKTNSTYLAAEKDFDREPVLEKMFRGLAEDAALMELSQHPSLAHLEIVKELDEFCSKKKNFTERVMNAVDGRHKLPLVYWSVWSLSTHLHHWCLVYLKDTVRRSKVLTEPVLISLLASLLSAEAGDSTLLMASSIVKDLAHHQLKPADRDLKLNLPVPSLREEDARLRLEQVKTRMRFSLCYLEDPHLPLPPDFVRVEVTKDGITVRAPGKAWYLLLRLLADKSPEERDDKGNTVLHLAVRSRHREVIRTAVRSGASLTARNRKGVTPYLLAQKHSRQAEKADPTVTDTGQERPTLHAACLQGDTELVKVLLCEGASLGERDGKGDTPLHVACRAGHADTASVLLRLKADVKACNRGNSTPLQEATSSGNQELISLLMQHEASAANLH